jgi:hypothetical protein
MSINEKLGEQNEFNILNIFLEKDIILNKRTYKYDVIDFYYETDNVFYEIELKTRKTIKNKYSETLLAKNKIKWYINNKKNNFYDKIPQFYIIFGFPDENDMNVYNYWYIKYNPSIFKEFNTFKNPYENNKLYYLIPVNLLEPIDGLISILNNT